MSETYPEVLAVSFQKGGTGKTFTSLNVAGGLAARGLDVLVIDLDPQGSLTSNLGKRPLFKDLDALSLDEILLDPNKWDQIGDIILTDHEEFDLIPSNQTFSGNKTPLDSADAGENRLGRVLSKLEKDYHYVVCDCPPEFSAYAKNAVTAGEKVVVPMEPKTEMPHSTELLFDQYEVLQMMHELDVRYLAFLMTINSTKMTKENERMVEWFEETFDEKGVITDDRAAFERAKKSQQSIYSHPESLRNDEIERYDELLQLILEQTSPPPLGLDVEAAKAMTIEDIRASVAEQEVEA
jgi:chromosome partitioning protein